MPEKRRRADTDAGDADGWDEGGAAVSKKVHRHAWQPVMSMQTLVLPPAVAAHIDQHGFDPVKFLTDRGSLRCNLLGPSGEELGAGDHFMTVWSWSLDLDMRTTNDHIRACFASLFYYDLAVHVRPKGTGRVGTTMKARMAAFLAAVPADQLDHAFACDTIEHKSILGKRINFLCEQFGPGCLFYLSWMLSENL